MFITPLSKNLFLLKNSFLCPFLTGNLYSWELLDLLPKIFHNFSFEKKTLIKKQIFFENQEKISIGSKCVFEPGVYIEGPCIIGNFCVIRHGASIRGGCVLCDHCLVGHATEIVRCLILDGAKLSHFNYVGDSVIGENVNLGSGSCCANLRLDEKPISFQLNGKKISTNKKKLGSFIGHDSKIGCNSVLNPGTIVFPGSKVSPCSSLKGFVRSL